MIFETLWLSIQFWREYLIGIVITLCPTLFKVDTRIVSKIAKDQRTLAIFSPTTAAIFINNDLKAEYCEKN